MISLKRCIATFLLFLLFIFSGTSNAQYSILLLDGTTVNTNSYEIIEKRDILNYKNHRNKIKEVDRDFVFSITDSTGNVDVYYLPDSVSFHYTVEQMQEYIAGEIDAKKNYKGHWHTIGGFGLGAGAIITLPAMGMNYFYAPLLSVGHVGVTGKVQPNESQLDLKQPDSAPYLKGYRQQVKKKRVRNATIGGLAGILTGYLVINLVNKIQ